MFCLKRRIQRLESKACRSGDTQFIVLRSNESKGEALDRLGIDPCQLGVDEARGMRVFWVRTGI